MTLLFRMLRGGEAESVLRKPIRESGRVTGQSRRLSADELDALAAEFRISHGVAAGRLRDRGVIMRPTVLDAEARRALELHTEGLSANRIGRLIGRYPKMVRSLIRRNGQAD